MAVENSTPSYFRGIYLYLIILGVVSFMVASSVMGFIAYEYVTREEIRNPVHKKSLVDDHHHSYLYPIVNRS